MDDVSCQGIEKDIFDCNPTLVNHNCGHSEDAGVICSPGICIFYCKIRTKCFQYSNRSNYLQLRSSEGKNECISWKEILHENRS